MSGELVLVTGGSGFVGAHCILKLVDAGFRVRTTVRSLKREPEVRAMLASGGLEHGEVLSVVAADLTSDLGWPEAVRGCDFVLHVASPFPVRMPKDESELVRPAREGALRVLRAARDAGVKRVVLTSSLAAIAYGVPLEGRTFTEEDWTNPDADVSAYVKSKTLAERAAWEFIAREGGSLELAVVNPVAIFGPLLGPDLSSSIEIARRLLSGAVPGLPHVASAIVDVRDVADLHLLAMTSPAASGERFLAVAGDSMSMLEMADVLKARLGAAADRVPTRVLPNWLVRIAAVFVPDLRELVPRLGKIRNASNEKAKRVLGWTPRSNEDALVATAQSLISLGLIPAGPTR
ncbi:MAG: aldehyde reductase [Microbacteriaceae bacterium]